MHVKRYTQVAVVQILIFFSATGFGESAPYDLSGDVFKVVGVSMDVSDEELKHRYQLALEEHHQDPMAIEILEYAKNRIALELGLVWIDGVKVRSFFELSGGSYNSDSDLWFIFHNILDEDTRQLYLQRSFAEDADHFGQFLAKLNSSDKSPSLIIKSPVGGMSLYNARLLPTLISFLNGLSFSSEYSSGEILWRLMRRHVLSASQGPDRVKTFDKEPLAGLLLATAQHLPADQKRKFVLEARNYLLWAKPINKTMNMILPLDLGRVFLLTHLDIWLQDEPSSGEVTTFQKCAHLLRSAFRRR